MFLNLYTVKLVSTTTLGTTKSHRHFAQNLSQNKCKWLPISNNYRLVLINMNLLFDGLFPPPPHPSCIWVIAGLYTPIYLSSEAIWTYPQVTEVLRGPEILSTDSPCSLLLQILLFSKRKQTNKITFFRHLGT